MLANASPETGDASDAGASAAEIRAFGEIVASSPGWARVRRVTPPERTWLEAESKGLLVGRVVGVERGRTEEVSMSTPDGAMTAAMERVSADLIVTVERSVGVDVAPGHRVAVPIGIWFSGKGAEHMDDTTARITGELAAHAPEGSRVGVYVAGIVADGDGHRAELANMADLPAPTAVVFEDGTGSLVSLDWLVNGTADGYLAAPTLDDILARAASLG